MAELEMEAPDEEENLQEARIQLYKDTVDYYYEMMANGPDGSVEAFETRRKQALFNYFTVKYEGYSKEELEAAHEIALEAPSPQALDMMEDPFLMLRSADQASEMFFLFDKIHDGQLGQPLDSNYVMPD